jgi:hypothetical protein
MIARIMAANPAIRMPRSQGGAAAGEPLTARQIALLTRWVEQGAKWQKHWSFILPTRPEVPKELKDARWVQNPIDAFVRQRLEREGLTPSPEADRGTLLRRITLDLTGLPPTLAELDAFLADKSANAYEKSWIGCFGRRNTGKRMAFPWLDAARYADSNGYQVDGARVMWRWRDWVIDAFNRKRAVRPVHGRAAGRRPFAERDARATDRDRLQSQSPRQFRGRHHCGRVCRRVRRRSGGHDVDRVLGSDTGVRAGAITTSSTR